MTDLNESLNLKNMSKLNDKKELLRIYLENVDKYEFETSLGDMRTGTCVLGVIAIDQTYLTTGRRIHTHEVMDYLIGKGATLDILASLVTINDTSFSREQAKARITEFLSQE